MPREIVTVQVGQCGLQLGTRFWDLALREHASHSSNGLFDESMGSFFRNVDSRHADIVSSNSNNNKSLLWTAQPIQRLKARAVLVDMEQNVISQTLRSELGELFDSRTVVNDVSGAGNNFAHGHHHYGDIYGDAVMESVRSTVEHCDSLQSFFVLHSMGGGTGSGLGTRITSLLHDHYPDVMRFTTAVFPSAEDDVITSPYNSTLALHQLIQHSDCVLPIDNEALINICQRIEAPNTKQQLQQKLLDKDKVSLLDSSNSNSSSNSNAQAKALKRRAFDDMNTIGSHLLTNLTCGMRFGGELNVDLNEICMTLVPYPSLHFLLPALAPLLTHSNTAHADALKSIDAMCGDLSKAESQLIATEPRAGLYLSCMLLGRGKVTVSDLQRNINSKLQLSMSFVHWNTAGFKIGVCSVPTIGYTHSVLALANNTAVTSIFDRMSTRARKMYRVRAHLHHYTEYMDEQHMVDAIHAVDDLVDGYDSITTDHQQQQQQQQRAGSNSNNSNQQYGSII